MYLQVRVMMQVPAGTTYDSGTCRYEVWFRYLQVPVMMQVPAGKSFATNSLEFTIFNVFLIILLIIQTSVLPTKIHLIITNNSELKIFPRNYISPKILCKLC